VGLQVAGADATQFSDAVFDLHGAPGCRLEALLLCVMTPGEPTKKGHAGMRPRMAFFVGWFRQRGSAASVAQVNY
jgi:hypothetical protein